MSSPPGLESTEAEQAPRSRLALVLATVQLCFGVVAGYAAVRAINQAAADSVGPALAVIAGILLLGLWGMGRDRRTAAIGLAVVTGLLAAASAIASIVIRRRAVAAGDWITGASFLGGIAALLWLVVTAAAVWEVRLARRPKVERWRSPVVVLSVVAVAVLALLATQAAVAPVVVRANLVDTMGSGRPAPARPSELNGEVRWTLGLAPVDQALPTAAGLAVSTRTWNDNPGSVTMLAATTGEVIWDLEVRQMYDAPRLAVTADGTQLIIGMDSSGEGFDQPYAYLTVDAASGAVTSVWPQRYAEADLLNGDPVLLQNDADLHRLTTEGSDQWTALGSTCPYPEIGATDAVVVTNSCALSEDDVLVGLNADSAAEMWRTTEAPMVEKGEVYAFTHGEQRLTIDLDSAELTALKLSDGRPAWQVTLDDAGHGCRVGAADPLAAAVQRDFLASCPVEGRSTSVITAFDPANGSTAWQTTLPVRGIADYQPIDDDQVLAITGAGELLHRGCSVDLITATGRRPVLGLDTVQCAGAELVRVGDSYFAVIREDPSLATEANPALGPYDVDTSLVAIG